jgi:hypothetical protein
LRNQFDQGDVTVDRDDTSDLRFPRRPFNVVSNALLGITASLVKRLVSAGRRLIRANLLVPWPATRRWSSRNAPARGRWGK